MNNDQCVGKLATVDSSPQPETVQYRDFLLRLAHRSLPLTHTTHIVAKLVPLHRSARDHLIPAFLHTCEFIWDILPSRVTPVRFPEPNHRGHIEQPKKL